MTSQRLRTTISRSMTGILLLLGVVTLIMAGDLRATSTSPKADVSAVQEWVR